MDGYSSMEISEKCGLSVSAVNFRVWHLRVPTENIGQLPIPPWHTKRTMILPSSHSPSGNQSAAGNGGGSVRPTVGVQLPWRQFAADRLVISLALSRISIFGVSGTNRKCSLFITAKGKRKSLRFIISLWGRYSKRPLYQNEHSSSVETRQ